MANSSRLALPHLTPSLKITLALAVVMVLLGALQAWAEPRLEFNRTAIEQGQWWRLLTSHWLHYGRYHLALNLGAFVLVVYILFQKLPWQHYLALLSACMLGVGLGIYGFSPQMAFYTGLSGVLHGLLVAGVLLTFRDMPLMNSLALVVVTAKIVQEQWPGFDATHPLLPVPIAVDAHLYGALAGLVWGLAVSVYRFNSRSAGSGPG